ncbi:MAG: hypothetical protein WB239_08750 [Acidimicrobiia bacterium]
MTNKTYIHGAEVSTASVRERFGGVDTPSAILGMLTALGVLVFLGALITAGAGNMPYQLNAYDIQGNLQALTIGGVAVAIVVVFVSFFVGGWSAGRMARYDGGINGIGVALWALLLVAIFAALGAWAGSEYNAFQQVGLPDWFSQIRGDDITLIAVISAAVAVVVMFVGAYLGGRMGELYHRKADAALADQVMASAVTNRGRAPVSEVQS